MSGVIKFVILLFFSIVTVTCIRTKDKMYDSIEGASCFRRLNGTHQTGCSSKFGGSVGVLHMVRSMDDVEFLLNNPPAPPYAPILTPSFFTRDIIMRFKVNAPKLISALVLIANDTSLKNFTHESRCPNQYSGLLEDQTCDVSRPETSWNPFGTGLLYEDLPFPMYLIAADKEMRKVVDCFDKFNSHNPEGQGTRSLCAIEINTFMSAAVSSEVCMRRSLIQYNLSPSSTKHCDPLEGKNVYATLFPRDVTENPEQREPVKDERFIMITTHLDTTTLFDGVGFGAMGSMVPTATLISVAHFLSKLMPQSVTNGNRNILFVLFNGEAYDYIGSQKLVYDMKTKTFPAERTLTNPITMDNIDVMIDIAALDDLSSMKVYHRTEFQQLNVFLKFFNQYTKEFALNITLVNKLQSNLPPSAAHSFLRENNTFPSLILQSTPKNRFLNSIYDDAENIEFVYKNSSLDFTELDNKSGKLLFPADSVQMKVRNMSSAIALSVYEMIAGQRYVGDELASSVLVDELLHCFLESADCPLFKASSVPHGFPWSPLPPLRYISVHGATSDSTGWPYRLFGFLVGKKIDGLDSENCTQRPLSWYAGFNGTGECHLTTQNFSQAISPAFLEEDYDWSSGKYSTWTESTWRELSARIFLRPSCSHEAITLAIGFTVLVISFVSVFLMNSRSDVLFGEIVASQVTTAPVNC